MVEQLQNQCVFVQAGQHTYHRLRQQLTLTVHPFGLSDSGVTTTTEIQAQLEQLLLQLETLQHTHQLPSSASVFHKFKQQVPALALGVNTWWHWVQQTLSLENLDTSLTNWLLGQMLPAVYWQLQLQKTKSRSLRRIYRQAKSRAHQTLRHHGFTATLTGEVFDHWRIVGLANGR